MQIKQIAENLGIEKYPLLAEEIASNTDLNATDFILREYISEIDNQYKVFGEYTAEVIEKAQKIKEDKDLLAWGNICIRYLEIANGNAKTIREFPMPKKSQTRDGLDVFPIIVLLGEIKKTVFRYKKRGFSQQEAEELAGAFSRCFFATVNNFKIIGMCDFYFKWLGLYAGTQIFNLSGFNFEVKKFEYDVIYIRNEITKQTLPLFINQKICKNGLVLGTAGATDEEGSFITTFEENDTDFIGYTCTDGKVVNKKRNFSKSEWKKIIVPGDDIISFHIPKNADFSPAHLDEAFKIGIEYAKKRFPDFNIKCILCHSWLLDPQLKNIIKPESKIVLFGNRYNRFPVNDDGKAVFTFVFPGTEKTEEWTENTTLERNLKKHYLEGKFVYNYAGIIEIE